MNSRIVIILLLIGQVSFSCSRPEGKKSPFTTNEGAEGIELLEDGHPVFFYQRKPKPSAGTFFNNYLHPLYDLDGDTLTEEFPTDHPHHRGIFWAWHQLYINDKTLGDGWIMENISQEVVQAAAMLDNEHATLRAQVLWKSSTIEEPFLEEHTSIIVHQQLADIRKIDFEITLKSLVPGVQIGGSEDAKGYGGFCARIKLPKSLVFTSGSGPVIPLEGQVVAGAWMDFSTFYDSTDHVENGLAILCHPSTPNYPAPWILRQTGSMQNVVFPGERRIEIPMDKPIVLRYRLIIHKGNAAKADIAALQLEYEQTGPMSN